jgi:hypothetical protein
MMAQNPERNTADVYTFSRPGASDAKVAPPMAALSLVCGALAAAAVAVPETGKYLALGLGLFATVAGVVAYRRSSGRARPRLLAAAGVTLGLVGLLLGGGKLALTLAAVDRLDQLL